MGPRVGLQGTENEVVNVVVSETETQYDQECIVKVQKVRKAIHKGRVGLLPRLVVFAEGRKNHFPGWVGCTTHYPGPAIKHAPLPSYGAVHLPESRPVCTRCELRAAQAIGMEERLIGANKTVKNGHPCPFESEL